MRALRSWLGLLGTLALAGLPVTAGAQPVGSEFQINTYTTSAQKVMRGRRVATDADGNFIVVWTSYGQDGSQTGVFGQRYDSAGRPAGAEFRANSYTTALQGRPSVASDAQGNFVVAWNSMDQDGDEYGIFARRYDRTGVPHGGEFLVNSQTLGSQQDPVVASDSDGNFVVVWSNSCCRDGYSSGIVARRYDRTGAPTGDDFRVSTSTSHRQSYPSVASDASGNFIVVWDSLFQDGENKGIFGQRYDSTGVAVGSEFLINSYTTNHQTFPAVASDSGGNFVVVWQSSGQDGSGWGIFGQRYASDGTPRGGEFRANTSTADSQFLASLSADAEGNVLVAWTSDVSNPSRNLDVRAQRFDSGGIHLGSEFQVNSYIPEYQGSPNVGAVGVNQFVVAWGSVTQDGSGYGVFGRRYDFAGGTITVVKPNTNVRWVIGSVKEIRWTHDLGADATFRIELDRNDDGSFEELIAADAPADSHTSGAFTWTVTGPPTGKARVRVSWTDDVSVSDSSDVTFQIRPVGPD